MEEEKKVIECEVCPVLNIMHKSGETTQVKFCVMDAALRQAKERYAVCGQERDIKFGDAPVEESVAQDMIEESELVESGMLEEIEKQAEEL